jgi:phosphohistidine phosphatase
MRLYLVQHAKAASKDADPERSLTEEGRREAQKVAAFIRPLNLSVDYMWHSGKKRAVQTSDILAEVVRTKQDAAAHGGLGPNDEVAALADELVSAQGDIIIVGHQPFLGKLASLLVTGSERANAIAFRNAGIVCLARLNGGQWQVEWIVTPEVI